MKTENTDRWIGQRLKYLRGVPALGINLTDLIDLARHVQADLASSKEEVAPEPCNKVCCNPSEQPQGTLDEQILASIKEAIQDNRVKSDTYTTTIKLTGQGDSWAWQRLLGDNG